MKFVESSVALAMGICCFATQALAADGEINFVGTVTANTCTAAIADVNGSAAGSVSMGNISALSLAKAGDTAGAAVFNLSLAAPTVEGGETNNCDLAKGTATVRFMSVSAPAGASGEWVGLTGAGGEGVATNVAIQIRDATGNVVAMGQNSTTYKNLSEPMRFTANYIATGVASAGKADAKAAFSIDYK
ncbi:fimbrial protein [Pseudomonas sp. HLT2-19-2]